MNGTAPLGRFQVIDLSRVRSGPTASRQLADWGADVVTVELPEHMDDTAPHVGPREGSDFRNLNRNKRSIAIDLKHPDGAAIVKKMVAGADVLIENFRPAVKHRLGLDYATLSAINPRLVYASISGFGQDGPYADRPGFDQIAQALGGLMSITGEAGRGPMRTGIPVADLSSGIFCAFGIVLALLERESSDKGQWVQTSLLQSQIFMLDFQAARWLMDGCLPAQDGNHHATIAPCGAFQAQDGWLSLAVVGEAIWGRFCAAIDRPDWATDARFCGNERRLANRAALHAGIDAALASKSRAYWIDRLNENGVPCGPICAIDEVFADPQVRHLGIAAELPDEYGRPVSYVAQPLSLSRTPSRIARRPPARGEHSEDILKDLGYSADAIADLESRGVI